MVALGTPLFATILVGGVLLSSSYTVRVPCAVETDAVCPTTSGPGNATDYIVRNFTNVGLIGFNIPSSQRLSLTDVAYSTAIQYVWIPWLGAHWRLQGNHVRSAIETCTNEVGWLQLNPMTTNLEWLKNRMWQVP